KRASHASRATTNSSSSTRSPGSRSTRRWSYSATDALRAARLDETHRFHDLRHTFGTQMAAAGVAIRTLQEWMGHRDIQTTMRYADYTPSAREAELISAAFDQTAAELDGGETEALFRPHT